MNVPTPAQRGKTKKKKAGRERISSALSFPGKCSGSALEQRCLTANTSRRLFNECAPAKKHCLPFHQTLSAKLATTAGPEMTAAVKSLVPQRLCQCHSEKKWTLLNPR